MMKTCFRSLTVALLLGAALVSASAFAATDGFGNDNFKGSYFDNQAPAALADDNGAALNAMVPAAGDPAKAQTPDKTGDATSGQNPENAGQPPEAARGDVNPAAAPGPSQPQP